MYYAAYLANVFPEHTFIPLAISQRINKIQRDADEYRQVMDTIRSADVVLWAFPIYKFWIPAQLIRFIELVSERGDEKDLAGKYTTVLTTSIRCFDHTAHNYIHQTSADWGMNFARGFSAEMEDIKDIEQREHLKNFFKRFLRRAEKQMPMEEAAPLPLPQSGFRYEPPDVETQAKNRDKKATLITDATDQDVNLLRMMDVFQKQLPYPVTQINLHDAMAANAWCVGCVKCIITGKCSKKDDFESILDPFTSSDILIVATAIRGRGISSTLKMFLDRTIVFGHTPGLIDQKPVVALLVSGPLRQLSDVQQMLRCSLKRFGVADVMLVTDEGDDSAQLTQRLISCVDELVWTSDSGFYMPDLFPNKAARTLLRDFMYTHRGVLPIDHSICKKKKLYGHLQLDVGNEIFNRIGVFATQFPNIRTWLAKNTQKILINNLKRAFPAEPPWK